MDSLEVTEEIIDQVDDEISGQEALEFVADWSVISSSVIDAQQKLWISSTKKLDLSKPLDEIFLWTH